MKIVQINTFSNKSTGAIMNKIHKYLLNNGNESYIVWGRGRKAENNHELFLDDSIGVYYHVMYTRLTDKTGFASNKSTKKLLDFLDKIKPDIVHLHNIHGYYINIKELFNYLKKNNIKIVWTLHDCWAFTGHCPHFEYIGCEKWQEKCKECPQINIYPKSYVDNSSWNYSIKKELFNGANLNIITPSKWLAKLVKKSFLKDYSVKIINNGINIDIFKDRKNNFRKAHNLENKFIILGVSSDWTERKGIYDFVKLSKKLPKDYIIILVGIKENQRKILTNNMIGIEKTNNQLELSKIYSSADVFFNPTYEDNYPTVNLEAIACGLPVFTYNSGGSIESAINGIIVKDVDDFLNKIIGKSFKKNSYKKVINISDKKMCEEYYKFYKEIINKE